MQNDKKLNFLIITGVVKNALFEIVQLVVTPGATDLLDRTGTNLNDLMQRHQRGNWGNLCAEDWQTNSNALSHGERIFSAYELGEGKERLWIVTEWDRSVTTALLPEEY